MRYSVTCSEYSWFLYVCIIYIFIYDICTRYCVYLVYIYICIYRERMIPIASYSIFISVWWPCRIAVSLHILSQACQGMRLSDVQPTMAVSGLIIGILGHGLFLQCDMCYLLFSTTRYTIHIIYMYLVRVCQVQLAIRYYSILARVPYQASVSTFSETRSTFLIPSSRLWSLHGRVLVFLICKYLSTLVLLQY